MAIPEPYASWSVAEIIADAIYQRKRADHHLIRADKAQIERDALRTEVKTNHAEIAGDIPAMQKLAEDRYQALEAAKLEIQSANATLVSERDALRTQLADAKKMNEFASQEYGALAAAKAKIHDQYSELFVKWQAQHTALAHEQSALIKRNEELVAVKRALESMTARFEDEHKIRTGLERDIKLEQSRVAELENKVTFEAGLTDELERDLEVERCKVSKLERDLEKANKQIEVLEFDNKDLARENNLMYHGQSSAAPMNQQRVAELEVEMAKVRRAIVALQEKSAK